MRARERASRRGPAPPSARTLTHIDPSNVAPSSPRHKQRTSAASPRSYRLTEYFQISRSPWFEPVSARSGIIGDLMRLQPPGRRWPAPAAFLLLVTAGVAAAATPARYVRYAEAAPILSELALAGALPPELGSLSGTQREEAWPAWIARHDQEVRARLEQGDEDTIVNWMLFGTSFTSKPRAILGAVEGDASAADREL